jgi:hypothetical protein
MARIEWRDLGRDVAQLRVADRGTAIRKGLIARGGRLADEARTEVVRRSDRARGGHRPWARRPAPRRSWYRRAVGSIPTRWTRAPKFEPKSRRIARPLVLVGISVGLALLATLLTALLASPSVRARVSAMRARMRDAVATRWGGGAARDHIAIDLEGSETPAPLDDLAPIVGIPIVGAGTDPLAPSQAATEPPSAIEETLPVEPVPAEAGRNGKPARVG